MKHLFLAAVIATLFSGCVVKAEPDHYHHHHEHDTVRIEARPVVEGRVIVE